jgi:hypothetical protein
MPPTASPKARKSPPASGFNLDAVLAESRDEDRSEPFPFVFGGEAFELPGLGDVDLRILEAFERGQNGTAMRRMLGEEQWARLEAVDALFNADAMGALLEAWKDHAGVDMGNSSASSAP